MNILYTGSPVSASEINANFTQTVKQKFTASDNLKFSADTERGSNAGSYTLVKEIDVYGYDTIRVKFDLKDSTGNHTYGKIYINGVAVGTERDTTNTSYTTYSQDFSGVKAGDKIQLYYWTNSGLTSAYTRNFRIYYDVTQLTADGEVITN